MASKNQQRLTQSPRALRDSTNDPEAHALGDVNLGMDTPRKSNDPINADVEEDFSKENAPYVDGSGKYF